MGCHQFSSIPMQFRALFSAQGILSPMVGGSLAAPPVVSPCRSQASFSPPAGLRGEILGIARPIVGDTPWMANAGNSDGNLPNTCLKLKLRASQGSHASHFLAD